MKISLLVPMATFCTFAHAASVADGSSLSTSSKGAAELGASPVGAVTNASDTPMTGSADVPSGPTVLATSAKATSVPESVSVVALVIFGYVLMLRRRSD